MQRKIRNLQEWGGDGGDIKGSQDMIFQSHKGLPFIFFCCHIWPLCLHFISCHEQSVVVVPKSTRQPNHGFLPAEDAMSRWLLAVPKFWIQPFSFSSILDQSVSPFLLLSSHLIPDGSSFVLISFQYSPNHFFEPFPHSWQAKNLMDEMKRKVRKLAFSAILRRFQGETHGTSWISLRFFFLHLEL